MTSWKLNLQNFTGKTDKGRMDGQETRDGVNPGGACFAVPKNKERDSVSDRMASREARPPPKSHMPSWSPKNTQIFCASQIFHFKIVSHTFQIIWLGNFQRCTYGPKWLPETSKQNLYFDELWHSFWVVSQFNTLRWKKKEANTRTIGMQRRIMWSSQKI